MELAPLGVGMRSDQRIHRCRACLTRKSVRHDSFLTDFSHSLQEFVRVVFYYFAHGYEPELAHRELTDNVEKGGAMITMSSIYGLYVHARDRISKYQIHSVEAKKFGG